MAATGKEAVTLKQLKSTFSAWGGSITPVVIDGESAEINGWKIQVNSYGKVFGWCTDKMLFISKVVTTTYGDVEPESPSQSSSINTRAVQLTYYFCDIYPVKEPVYWTSYNYNGSTTKIYIGEKEYYDRSLLKTQSSEYDESSNRYRLKAVSGEPSAGLEDITWEPNILYIID